MKKKTPIPFATINRLMKEYSGQRISGSAVMEMINLTNDYIEKVSTTAASIAKNAGRKTIKKRDIEVSAEEIHGVISVWLSIYPTYLKSFTNGLNEIFIPFI